MSAHSASSRQEMSTEVWCSSSALSVTSRSRWRRRRNSRAPSQRRRSLSCERRANALRRRALLQRQRRGDRVAAGGHARRVAHPLEVLVAVQRQDPGIRQLPARELAHRARTDRQVVHRPDRTSSSGSSSGGRDHAAGQRCTTPVRRGPSRPPRRARRAAPQADAPSAVRDRGRRRTWRAAGRVRAADRLGAVVRLLRVAQSAASPARRTSPR